MWLDFRMTASACLQQTRQVATGAPRRALRGTIWIPCERPSRRCIVTVPILVRRSPCAGSKREDSGTNAALPGDRSCSLLGAALRATPARVRIMPFWKKLARIFRSAKPCPHMDRIRDVTPSSPDSCNACLAMGDTWVNLRICLICGNVGCCDNSKNTHATKHFRTTGHPVLQSYEPGEAWRYCYVDEQDLPEGQPLRQH